ncbi:MAG TPA: hypothetical protein VEW47_03775 [Candidatus Dormibacteraeota bacterium]|nr:hypothetical protein [Candidatus Dormibacteraeota bacterium]
MRPRVSCRAVAVLMAVGLPAATVLAEEQGAQPTAAPVAQAVMPASTTQEEIEALRREIEDLKNQIRALRDQVGAGPAPVQPTAPPPGPILAPAPAAVSSQTSNYFNPSVSVIGNYLGVGGSNGTENLPSSSLRESEVSFQAVVDPYARADFFLSFGEEGVGVEEGFVTFTSLPGGALAKVGRMRTAFGKINPLHLHVLPWPDEPLPIVNLLGGEEGWIGTGVSGAFLLPLGDVFSEATVQVLRGDSGELFAAPQRGDLAYNGHYRVFGDLSEATNLEVGLSYGQGPNGLAAGSKTRLEGVDATLRWKPLRTATYRSASFRGEFIRSRREDPLGDQTADGWFLSGEYQLAKRWFTGARIEAAGHADDAAQTDRGKAVLLTFWPSEFSQLRGELRRREYADGETANEVLLQLQFAIGAHGAHPF